MGSVSKRRKQKCERSSRVGKNVGSSLKVAADFAESVLVAGGVEGDMSILFGAEDAIPDDHLVLGLIGRFMVVRKSVSTAVKRLRGPLTGIE